MRNQSAIIVENNTGKLIAKRFKVTNIFARRAFAEEAGGEEETTPTTPTINYEDLIAKARKEEKDKQYAKIKKLEDANKILTEQHNADLLKIGTLEEDVKKLNEQLSKAGKGDSEEIKGLKESIKALTKEKEILEDKVAHAKTVDEEEIRARIKEELEEEYEVKLYKTTKLAEHKEELLVPELVYGSTKEEIDNSLQNALARSQEILERAGVSRKKTTTPQRQKATSPSISTTQDNNEYSMEYIATLDVRSPEYKEFRRKMGLDR